jgi:hypothetical protein
MDVFSFDDSPGFTGIPTSLDGDGDIATTIHITIPTSLDGDGDTATTTLLVTATVTSVQMPSSPASGNHTIAVGGIIGGVLGGVLGVGLVLAFLISFLRKRQKLERSQLRDKGKFALTLSVADLLITSPTLLFRQSGVPGRSSAC